MSVGPPLMAYRHHEEVLQQMLFLISSSLDLNVLVFVNRRRAARRRAFTAKSPKKSQKMGKHNEKQIGRFVLEMVKRWQ